MSLDVIQIFFWIPKNGYFITVYSDKLEICPSLCEYHLSRWWSFPIGYSVPPHIFHSDNVTDHVKNTGTDSISTSSITIVQIFSPIGVDIPLYFLCVHIAHNNQKVSCSKSYRRCRIWVMTVYITSQYSYLNFNVAITCVAVVITTLLKELLIIMLLHNCLQQCKKRSTFVTNMSSTLSKSSKTYLASQYWRENIWAGLNYEVILLDDVSDPLYMWIIVFNSTEKRIFKQNQEIRINLYLSIKLISFHRYILQPNYVVVRYFSAPFRQFVELSMKFRQVVVIDNECFFHRDNFFPDW